MTPIQMLAVSTLIFTIAGCGDSSYSSAEETSAEDRCNDQAWAECAHIAREECGLSRTASDRELRACRPYAQCDDAAFDACMDEHE